MRPILVAPIEQSKYLFGTSIFFMAPALYAFLNNYPFMSGMISLTSLVSANFWRKPDYSIRRDCDLIITKISYAIQCYNAAKYINNTKYMLFYYPFFMMSSYSYSKSNKLYINKNKKWFYYHITMHLSVITELFIILNSIKEEKKNGKKPLKNIAIIMSMNTLYVIGMNRIK